MCKSFFLGSLGTSVFDTDVYLVGASGGVYALLAAHLANILLVSLPLKALFNTLWKVAPDIYRFLLSFVELQQYGIRHRPLDRNLHSR